MSFHYHMIRSSYLCSGLLQYFPSLHSWPPLVHTILQPRTLSEAPIWGSNSSLNAFECSPLPLGEASKLYSTLHRSCSFFSIFLFIFSIFNYCVLPSSALSSWPKWAHSSQKALFVFPLSPNMMAPILELHSLSALHE